VSAAAGRNDNPFSAIRTSSIGPTPEQADVWLIAPMDYFAAGCINLLQLPTLCTYGAGWNIHLGLAELQDEQAIRQTRWSVLHYSH
jgi:hypothetical protein